MDTLNLGFNPSFTGIALVAKLLPPQVSRNSRVSILLLLELPWWPLEEFEQTQKDF